MNKQVTLKIRADVLDADSETCLKGDDVATSPVPWDASNWLAYYSECLKFLLALGAKFVSLVTQSSVYATAVCAAIVTLRREHGSGNVYFLVACAASLPLLVYWHFLVRYRKQIKETGTLAGEVEKHFMQVPDELRLVNRLRNKAPIYGLMRTTLFAYAYPGILILVVLTLGFLLSCEHLDFPLIN